MWEQYKKTFVGIQVVILIVTLVAFFGLHRLWSVAGAFFLMMQVGAVFGALWATRLTRLRRRFGTNV